MTREVMYRSERNKNSRRIIHRHVREMQSMICKGAASDIELGRITLTPNDCGLMGEFVKACEELEKLADRIYGPYVKEKEDEEA